LQRRRHLHGQPSKFSGIKDISWFHPEGRPFNEDEWDNPNCQALGYVLEGSAIEEMAQDGKRLVGDTLCVLINAQFHDVTFKLPIHQSSNPWALVLMTTLNRPKLGQIWEGGNSFLMPDHSVSVFVLYQTASSRKIMQR